VHAAIYTATALADNSVLILLPFVVGFSHEEMLGRFTR
jgi:hypothetical protein